MSDYPDSERDYQERLYHQMIDIENELIAIRKLLELLVQSHKPNNGAALISYRWTYPPDTTPVSGITTGNAVTVNPAWPGGNVSEAD